MGPQVWLIAALFAAIPATYGVMKVKMHAVEIAAYAAGKKVGEETVAAAVTASAREVVAATLAGEASAAPVPQQREAIVALCQRSASCRERKKP